MRSSTLIRGLLAVALAAAAAGCKSGPLSPLPQVEPVDLSPALGSIPQGASPVFSWRGFRTDLATYWDRQAVTVNVQAHIPAVPRPIYEGYWSVECRNAEGKLIPFIGVLARYRNENGTELAKVAPEVDTSTVKDCLYVVIEPNVTRRDGKVVSIRPTAYIVESRRRGWTPLLVKVPLYPEDESTLTPLPDPLPPEPKGTPIAVP